jgi:hypothetical protein
VPPNWEPPTYQAYVEYPEPVPPGRAYMAPDWLVLNALGPLGHGVDYRKVIAPRARSKDLTLVRGSLSKVTLEDTWEWFAGAVNRIKRQNKQIRSRLAKLQSASSKIKRSWYARKLRSDVDHRDRALVALQTKLNTRALVGLKNQRTKDLFDFYKNERKRTGELKRRVRDAISRAGV